MEEKIFTESEVRNTGDQLGIDWKKTDFKEFTIGMEIEMEHGLHDPSTDVTGNDPVLTGKIALAHLNEFPDYYSRLLKYFGEENDTDSQTTSGANTNIYKVTVLAEINVLAGFEEQVFKAANDVWVETRKEPGCEVFSFNMNKDNGLKIIFYEVFSSNTDFEIHKEAEHTKVFLNFLKGKVLQDEPQLLFLNQITD